MRRRRKKKRKETSRNKNGRRNKERRKQKKKHAPAVAPAVAAAAAAMAAVPPTLGCQTLANWWRAREASWRRAGTRASTSAGPQVLPGRREREKNI